MSAAAPKLVGDGPFSPLLPVRLLASRLRTGRFLRTDAGLECVCTSCNQAWPWDTEFWYFTEARGWPDAHVWCRACHIEWQDQRRQARHDAGARPGPHQLLLAQPAASHIHRSL